MEKCIVDGCSGLTHRKLNQYCSTHYWRFQRYGTPELPKRQRTKDNPLYRLWFERKQNGVLSDEWLDFQRFAAEISPKPDGDHFLLRRDATKPFSPENYLWLPHLRRREGESRKEWWARKWQARQLANPGMERKRSLKRRFGLSVEQYDAMVAKQNGKCAICGGKETSIDPKSGTIKNLAVDHCHTTGKVRELLCWECNSCLGKMKESVDRLQAMISYIRKHE